MPVVRLAYHQAQRHQERETTLQVYGLRTPVPFGRHDDRQGALDALPSQQADDRRDSRHHREKPFDHQAQASWDRHQVGTAPP